MTVRYFKATFSGITCFRSSRAKVYLSATLSNGRGTATPATFHVRHQAGASVVEITETEFRKLRGLARARLNQGRSDRTRVRQRFMAPSDSWVRNDQLGAK